MREILFRGKDRQKDFWIIGILLVDEEGNPFIMEKEEVSYDFGYLDCCKLYAVKRETVGQYTGLTDKNSTKIFEGDIVKYGDRKGKIFFYANFGMFMISFASGGGSHFMNINHTEVEVIGNIHDNLELLGESNENRSN